MEEQELIQIKVAEIEVRYVPTYKISELPQIMRAQDAYNILLQTWDKAKINFVEQFKVIVMNRSNRVLGICTISTGCVCHTVADPKLVFAVALKCNASSIIIAHNHPSGSLKPSENDIGITERMKQCARILDIQFKDSIIVTSEGYYSFTDEGAL